MALRVTCVLLVGFMGYFDWLHIERLIDNWELILYSEVSKTLKHLYLVSSLGYSSLTLFVGLVVYWSWK